MKNKLNRYRYSTSANDALFFLRCDDYLCRKYCIVPAVKQDLQRRQGGSPGPGERAGVSLGDVILGINYEPLERGLVHTSELLAKAITIAGFVKLQVSLIRRFFVSLCVCFFCHL